MVAVKNSVCISLYDDKQIQVLTSQSMKIILRSSLWKAIFPFFSYAAHILEAIAAVTFASLSPDPAYDNNDPSWLISLRNDIWRMI